MNSKKYIEHVTEVLEQGISVSLKNHEGRVADYIPELSTVDPELLAACVTLTDGTVISRGANLDFKFTLQSVSKLVLLIGLIEEFGTEKVFSWIDAEPSGQPFASIGHLEQYGPVPSNPLINAGAICLSSRIPGDTVKKQCKWIEKWVHHLFSAKLSFSKQVFESEYKTADRNRSLAYLMKSTGILKGEVEDVLKPYLSLCAYEANVVQAAIFPTLLANGGIDFAGKQIISEECSNHVVSLMATCGLYDESGMNLIKTGLPSKSGVSGLLISVATGRAGVAVFSPKLNRKGTSVRGHIIVSEISKQLDWHFAAPWGFTSLNGKNHRDSTITTHE